MKKHTLIRTGSLFVFITLIILLNLVIFNMVQQNSITSNKHIDDCKNQKIKGLRKTSNKRIFVGINSNTNKGLLKNGKAHNKQ